MTRRSLGVSWSIFWLGSAAIMIATIVGCSSEAQVTGCFSGETTACTCENGQPGTMACGNPECVCGGDDSGTGAVDAAVADAPAVDTPGDATHLDEKAPPSSVYAECAVKGSFGWPCTLTTSGPDPSECTDPNYPDCFVGGQASWCTASCATFGICPGPEEDAGDAGCVPSACNARGYCK